MPDRLAEIQARVDALTGEVSPQDAWWAIRDRECLLRRVKAAEAVIHTEEEGHDNALWLEYNDAYLAWQHIVEEG